LTILAAIFDFDDTIVPDSTTEFLDSHNVNSNDFWLKDVKSLTDSGWDPTLAYLKTFLGLIGETKPLGQLSDAQLREFGQTLDSKCYPGLPQIFEDLKNTVKKYRDIDIEFYIISGGLQSIIEGSKIIHDNFSGVYGCQLAGDEENGVLRYIKRAITFTEKTRYLFEINKGVTPGAVKTKPYLVNLDKSYEQRRIKFSNMIYVGDGLTDIPCFTLIMKGPSGYPEERGTAFAVFDPKKTNGRRSAKQALQDFLKPNRVVSAHKPDYTPDSELGSFIRAAVGIRCSEINLRQELATT